VGPGEAAAGGGRCGLGWIRRVEDLRVGWLAFVRRVVGRTAHLGPLLGLSGAASPCRRTPPSSACDGTGMASRRTSATEKAASPAASSTIAQLHSAPRTPTREVN